MEKEFNQEDALKVIRQNIELTKETFKEKGWIYLLLGWLVFIALVVNFLMIRFTADKSTDITWLALIVVTGIPTIDLIIRKGKNPRDIMNGSMAKRPVDYIWYGFSATLFITVLRMNDLGPGVYPIIIMLFGSAAVASGGVLNIKSLIKGGTYCYFLALFCFLLKGQYLDYRMLFLAASVLCSFIIPGHLIRAGKTVVQ